MEKNIFTPEQQRPPAEVSEGQEFLDHKARESEKARKPSLSQQGVEKDAQELMSRIKEGDQKEETPATLEEGPVLTQEQAIEAINKIIEKAEGDGDKWTEFLQKNMK